MTHAERDYMTQPRMARRTDPPESHLHDRAEPKDQRMMQILWRLASGDGPQAYTTLCQFGQEGGAGTSAGLLTELHDRGLIRPEGKIGRARAWVLTDEGRRSLGGALPSPPRPEEPDQLELL